MKQTVQMDRIQEKMKAGGITRDGFLMLGVPGETRESVAESLEVADSLELSVLKITIGVRPPAEKVQPAVRPTASEAARPAAPTARQPSQSARSVLIFAAFMLLLGSGWYLWGDRISDQLARWGKGKETRETQGSTAGVPAGRMGSAPPLPVETGPREPKPAEPSAEAAKAAVAPMPGAAAAAAPKPEAKEAPPAGAPAKAELKTVAPPPAVAASAAGTTPPGSRTLRLR